MFTVHVIWQVCARKNADLRNLKSQPIFPLQIKKNTVSLAYHFKSRISIAPFSPNGLLGQAGQQGGINHTSWRILTTSSY